MTPEESAFAFEPPKELVAQEPLHNRADARLMLVNRATGQIDHFHIRNLPDLLKAGDRLILNDTRVIHARLVGKRVLSGGRWQGLFLGLDSKGRMELLQKTRGKMNPGEVVHLDDREGRQVSSLCLEERGEQGRWFASLPKKENPHELLEQIGRVPLPPYIRGGEMTDADVDRYQTVFAKNTGAVAAPTAGLHFTPNLMQHMKKHGTEFSSVTLHVGLGTFKPISVDSLDEHVMHSEWVQLKEETANAVNDTKKSGGRVIAVGTTSVRVLESAAKAAREQRKSGELSDEQQVVVPFSGDTDLFIRPPYEFSAVDALLTNFHFPRTTLLTLVCTFAGRELMQKAYREAIKERYRFFSYGDAMLIV